jgi:putative hydrolase of the HAD superfamily
VLISGELGYRKPHPRVYHRLIENLGVERHEILYVGDDPEPDIHGAQRVGLQPVWFTYVRDRNIPPAPGIMSRASEEPECQVPRISEWQEFLNLLTQ